MHKTKPWFTAQFHPEVRSCALKARTTRVESCPFVWVSGVTRESGSGCFPCAPTAPSPQLVRFLSRRPSAARRTPLSSSTSSSRCAAARALRDSRAETCTSGSQ
eukprot:6209525-Pleurochrysis_carterae.AAC.4